MHREAVYSSLVFINPCSRKVLHCSVSTQQLPTATERSLTNMWQTMTAWQYVPDAQTHQLKFCLQPKVHFFPSTLTALQRVSSKCISSNGIPGQHIGKELGSHQLINFFHSTQSQCGTSESPQTEDYPGKKGKPSSTGKFYQCMKLPKSSISGITTPKTFMIALVTYDVI